MNDETYDRAVTDLKDELEPFFQDLDSEQMQGISIFDVSRVRDADRAVNLDDNSFVEQVFGELETEYNATVLYHAVDMESYVVLHNDYRLDLNTGDTTNMNTQVPPIPEDISNMKNLRAVSFVEYGDEPNTDLWIVLEYKGYIPVIDKHEFVAHGYCGISKFMWGRTVHGTLRQAIAVFADKLKYHTS